MDLNPASATGTPSSVSSLDGGRVSRPAHRSPDEQAFIDSYRDRMTPAVFKVFDQFMGVVEGSGIDLGDVTDGWL